MNSGEFKNTQEADDISDFANDFIEEVDIPIEYGNFKSARIMTVDNKYKKDWFNLVKGHKLLGICVALIFIIFLLDFFLNDKKNTGQVLEILKILLFTLSGYLYGKREP